MILKVKKLDKEAKLPERKRQGDAGLDLYSLEDVELKPGEKALVRTGIAVEIPEGYFGLIKDRSGLAAKNKAGPSPKLLMHMEEILHRLDDRILISKPSTKPQARKGISTLDVCPEVYKGSKEGYPYYAKGWAMTNCTNAKPIKSVITILINAVTYSQDDFQQLDYVLNGTMEAYPTVDVYVAAQSRQRFKTLKKYKNVKVFKQSNSARPNVGQTWNMLINKAYTPYVLIARDVVHFSWLSQLERQIRVISEIPNVGVAGGSYRNLSGHWKMGCYQSTMKNYVLEYQEGYFYSRNECMYCDYVQGPFVARKSMLKFDENLSNEVVFEDLFLSLTTSGTSIMGCPDAMYFTTDYSSYAKRKERKLWLAFAKKWVLNRVLLPRGVKHSFSCKDIGFKCIYTLTRSYLWPVCCQEQYAHALAFLQDFANMNNFSFELDTGSVLGTVKFNGLLPWDVDGDLSILSSDIGILGDKKTMKYFKEHGIFLKGYKPHTNNYNGYVDLRLPKLDIEVWGMPHLTNPQFLPVDLQSKFTLAQVRDSWIFTVFSPGLFARNRYGAEILKHSQSWRTRGNEHSYSNYSSGIFLSCEQPEHHSCLYDFPADGNIPFLVP